MRRLQRLFTVLAVPGLLLLLSTTADSREWKLNPGTYANNYIKLVSTNETWLIHPTGAYPEEPAESRKKAGYLPDYEEVDDMESTVLEMRERGYVMIGYAAVNTRERGDAACDPKALDPNELAGCRLGTWLARRNPDTDPLGDPVDAGIWANASLVVMQRNFSFSRGEMRQVRIVSDQGSGTTTMQGGSAGRTDQQWGSSTTGTSQVQGQSKTKGQWDQSGQHVEGSVGTESSNVSGGADWSQGGSQNKTTYGETAQHQSNTTGQTTGTNQQAYGQTVAYETKHWTTALVEKQVDHYDLMVTFWKKADPNRLIFGALTDPTPRELWSVLGTRQARMVSAVIGGTPAFASEVWEGDVLLAINNEPIRGEQGLSDLLGRYRGQSASVTIWREGDIRELPVRFNNPSP